METARYTDIKNKVNQNEGRETEFFGSIYNSPDYKE